MGFNTAGMKMPKGEVARNANKNQSSAFVEARQVAFREPKFG